MPGVLCCLKCQAHRGTPCLGFYSVDLHVRHFQGHPGWCASLLFSSSLKGAPRVGSYSAVQCVRCLMGQSLYCSAADAGMWGERDYGDSSTHYARLPDFPPQSPPSHPLIRLSTVNSSPCPGIAPQSLNSSSQPLHLPGQLCVPVQGMYGCSKDSLILIPFRPPQISCFTLILKCFSFDSDNCPKVGF